MDREELAPGIFLYRNVLDKYHEIVQVLEDANLSGVISWSPAQVKSSEDVKVDTDTRDTLVIGIDYMFFKKRGAKNTPAGAILSQLSESLHNSLSKCEEDYKIFHNLATSKHDNYSVLKYGEGQKFTNHIDDHKDYPRRMSTVLYLNHNYSGGEIVFPRFGITYKPKANEHTEIQHQ